MKKTIKWNAISLIAIFLISTVFSLTAGYKIGDLLCWIYYNRNSPKISETVFLKMGEEEIQEMKRDAGLRAALLYNEFMDGKASYKDMVETQKIAESQTDTMITVNKMRELLSISKVPPGYISVLSGLISIIISFFFFIFPLTLLRNLAIKGFGRSKKYAEIASNLECVGPFEYITKSVLILKGKFDIIKKRQH